MAQPPIQDTLQAPIQDSLQAPIDSATGLTGLFETYPLLETAIWAAGILLVAWLANVLTRRYILKAISKVVTQTRFTWDDVIFKRKVFRRLADVAPAVVFYYGAPLIPGDM